MNNKREFDHSFDLEIAFADGSQPLERSRFFAEEPADDGNFDCAGTFGSAGTFGGTLGTVGTFGCCC